MERKRRYPRHPQLFEVWQQHSSQLSDLSGTSLLHPSPGVTVLRDRTLKPECSLLKPYLPTFSSSFLKVALQDSIPDPLRLAFPGFYSGKRLPVWSSLALRSQTCEYPSMPFKKPYGDGEFTAAFEEFWS